MVIVTMFAMLASTIVAPMPTHHGRDGLSVTSEVACARSIGTAIATGAAAAVPATCWRIGPLQLGMSEAEVAREIGKPFSETETDGNSPTVPRRFHAAVYAVPRGPVIPFARNRPWFVELRFEAGRLVAIDTSVNSITEFGRCLPSLKRHAISPIVAGVPSGPLSHFGLIKIGSRLSTLRQAFGRMPNGNRPKDWFNYWPIPISIYADGQTITAIAIATDEDAMMVAPPLVVVEKRDPTTCRPVSINYSLKAYRTAPPAAR